MDGLRGFAAMIIVMYHCNDWFSPVYIDSGYLVVDLFFVMSGFVIASAYDRKLAPGGIGAHRFMRLRLVRLYPLYLLGTLLGTAGLLLRMPHSEWHLIVSALPLALLMLPCPIAMQSPDGTIPGFLYPLNEPSWSLFFELLANTVYAFCFRFLSTRVLLALVSAAALLLVAKAVRSDTGSINGGWARVNAYFGVVRVAYGFFLGVLLFRLHSGRRRTSNVVAVGIVVLFLLIFLVPVPPALEAVFTLSVVLFVIPALVWAGASFEPSRWVRAVLLFFGTASYSLYMLHLPVTNMIRATHVALPEASLLQTVLTDVGLMLFLVLLAAFAEKRYDGPIRRRLLRGVSGGRRRSELGAATVEQ
nr:acyltransferase [Burkholderia sp. Ax-1719]